VAFRLLDRPRVSSLIWLCGSIGRDAAATAPLEHVVLVKAA
jgi:hypothetical protein